MSVWAIVSFAEKLKKKKFNKRTVNDLWSVTVLGNPMPLVKAAGIKKGKMNKGKKLTKEKEN